MRPSEIHHTGKHEIDAENEARRPDVKVGDTLPNGGVVLKIKPVQFGAVIVLALWESEFVTWSSTTAGDCYWGHYHGQDLSTALADFTLRT